VRLASRLLAASFAIGSLLAGPLAAQPVGAAETTDPLVVVLPPGSVVPGTATPVVDGPFDLVVEVSGAGSEDVVLTPQLPSWWISLPQAPSKTIPGGSCLVVCRVSWRIDPAAQTAPWYAGVAGLDVIATMGDRSIQTYGAAADYRPVVQPTWVTQLSGDATANTVANSAGVFDTGGEVGFAGISGRGGGERIQVSVIPYGGDLSAPRLAPVDASWGPDTDEWGYSTGRARIDTSGLPEGVYRVVAQAHDGAGHWSFATPSDLIVVHSPLVTLDMSGPTVVATGRETTATVTVRGLRSPQTRPGTVRLTVGGVEHVVPADTSDWSVPAGPNQPASRPLPVPTKGLPVGRTVVDVEVRDVNGAVLGTASTSFEIVDFKETVSIPRFVVGTSSSVRLRATAPTGTTLLQCHVGLLPPLLSSPFWNLCPGPNATSVDALRLIVPSNAGTGLLELDILGHDGVLGPQRNFPVTVYAKRTASLAAPGRATWGTTQTAKVTVLDEKTIGVRSAAGSAGTAAIRYSHKATGRLRALVKGAVPGTTVRTPERSTTSVARVSWSSLPTSARAGSLVTAAVYARPYEQGAVVRFQARKVGTWTWRTYATGGVASTSYAKTSARLWSKGTWEVRIQRVGTTLQATGYSTVRRISIT